MAQVGWIFDLSRCVGCRACTVACMMENNTPSDIHYRWVLETESGAYPNPGVRFLSMACYHCEEPACMASCPVSAITKDADGRVLIDDAKCIGCKYCMATCPYGAPQWNARTKKVEKCTYCVQRTSTGLEPACARTCVGGAIQAATDVNWATGTSDPADWAPRRLTKPAVKFIKS